MRKHFFNERYFENIDTEEKAYWLGFISADGSINSPSEFSKRLSICQSVNDKEQLEKFLQCIEANDVKISSVINKAGYKIGNEICRISLNSNALCQDLYNLGVKERKTYDLSIPNIRDDLMSHYLRGLIDGDGCFYYRYSENEHRYRFIFSLTEGCEPYLQQIKKYLESKEIFMHIYQPKNKEHSFILSSGSHKEIVSLIRFLYKNATIYMDRKYQKAKYITDIAV